MRQEILLHDQLQAAGLPAGPDVIALFSAFHDLLVSWNQKMNLVSPADMERLVPRHFLECAGLAITVPMSDRAKVLDLGSGAGFPGIPLKIVRPDLEMVLVESRRKRALFLQEAVQVLGLREVEIAAMRAEDLAAPHPGFDVVVSRAVADLSSLYRWTMPLLTPGGVLAVLKGMAIEKELEGLIKTAANAGSGGVSAAPYDPFSISLRERGSMLVTVTKR
ncbi:16S rRNA (guanine(527)-N(7))-methyltransferase RsmG [bacterium]|nr:16S rRNA (guanine(527)-N(7))-methyltransferase RsmG [bacterium]